MTEPAIVTAIRYAEGLREALDVIYDQREAGHHPTPRELTRLEEAIADCDTHPAFATTFSKEQHR